MTQKIHPSRFKPADTARNIWVIVPEAAVKYEDILDPTYWAHIAARLRPMDRIEVFAEDGSYWAELLVISAVRLSAKVIELRKQELSPSDASAGANDFVVQWKGPHHKHAVVRLKDKQALQTGFETKEDAMAWLASNSKSLAA